MLDLMDLVLSIYTFDDRSNATNPFPSVFAAWELNENASGPTKSRCKAARARNDGRLRRIQETVRVVLVRRVLPPRRRRRRPCTSRAQRNRLVRRRCLALTTTRMHEVKHGLASCLLRKPSSKTTSLTSRRRRRRCLDRILEPTTTKPLSVIIESQHLASAMDTRSHLQDHRNSTWRVHLMGLLETPWTYHLPLPRRHRRRRSSMAEDSPNLKSVLLHIRRLLFDTPWSTTTRTRPYPSKIWKNRCCSLGDRVKRRCRRALRVLYHLMDIRTLVNTRTCP